jgi:hypothetical protein
MVNGVGDTCSAFMARCASVQPMSFADDVKATLEAGRAATTQALRSLADRLDRLPLDEAAEVLAGLGPLVDRLRREAEAIFRGRDKT